MSYYEEHKNINKVRSDRYRNCKLLRDKESQESLLSVRDIEAIPESSADKFHTVQPNEVGRIDLIAYRYYKNPLLWWVIAQANDVYDPFTGTESGMLLRIPAIETLYGYRGVLL